jgi:hypothetical protein
MCQTNVIHCRTISTKSARFPLRLHVGPRLRAEVQRDLHARRAAQKKGCELLRRMKARRAPRDALPGRRIDAGDERGEREDRLLAGMYGARDEGADDRADAAERTRRRSERPRTLIRWVVEPTVALGPSLFVATT